MNDQRRGGKKFLIIPALLILAIIIYIIVKLIIWDRSGDIELEEVEEGAFDYESLDIVFAVDEEILAAHGDDGINDIVLIGNSFVETPPDGRTIADIISEMPDNVLTTLCCPNSKVADINNAYDTNEVSEWQAGYLFDIVKAMCTKDYSLQKAALDLDIVITQEYYDELTSVDLEKTDTLIIMYDSLDYRSSSPLYNPADKYDTSTYEGALRASITKLQTEFPFLKIIVASPYLHGIISNDGEDYVPASILNYGNGNLSEYVMRQYNIAMECCVSYADNYFGMITEDNMLEYCDVGTVFGLSDKGRELIGNHMKEFIARKY